MTQIVQLILDLGRAGVEIAPDSANPMALRHRPSALPPELAGRLRTHKSEVLRHLAVGATGLNEVQQEVFQERGGIGIDLHMPVQVGSPAWLIALGEALSTVSAETAGVRSPIDQGSPSMPERYAALVSAVFGQRVWPRVMPVGTRFPGEPDWNATYLKALRPKNGGAP